MMRVVAFIFALLCVECGGRGSSQRFASENTALIYPEGSSMSLPDSLERIEFAERVFDFGTVREEDGIVSHRFTFRNRSDHPIVITRMQTTCQCIRTDF